jgi:hypothetical protein
MNYYQFNEKNKMMICFVNFNKKALCNYKL